MPVIQKRIQSIGGRKKSIYVNEGKKNRWGVLNFCPDKVEGEDAISLGEHHKTLTEQSTLKPNCRNEYLIRIAMDKTFAERRQYITNGVHPIEVIREKHPLLFSLKGILEEFNRLTSFSLTRCFEDNLARFEEALLALPPRKHESDIWKTLREEIKDTSVNDERSCE